MKQWTKHDARSNQTVEADQFNEQHTSFRSQMTGLDRAQYPENCAVPGNIVDNAMHKVWVFDPWDTGVANALGEQTALRSAAADTRGDQWMAGTYVNHTSGWVTVFETTLSPFKGGNLMVEWAGNSAIQQFFHWTTNTRWAPSASPAVQSHPNDKYMALRILVNGVVLTERLGPAKPIDHFIISGAQQLPSGPVTLTCQMNPTGAGPDDAVVDDSGSENHLMQAHLFSNRVVAIGRWR